MTLRPLLVALPLALAACPASDDTSDGASADGADDGSGPGTAPADDDTAAMGDGGVGLQETWGAPCATDDDCVAVLGEGGVCLFQAVVYALPGGYCSKKCALPDDQTTVVLDAADCDPAGGVHCIGQMTVDFQYCAPACDSDAQCNRSDEGYICRQMPQIAQPEDPKFCLMPDCCLGTECSC